jgi:hypothetical protein
MGVADPRPKQPIEKPRQKRHPDNPVRPRHRPRLDPAEKPIPNHHIRPVGQRGQQLRNIREPISPIRIRHHNPLTACRRNPSPQRRPISACKAADDTGSCICGKFRRAI